MVCRAKYSDGCASQYKSRHCFGALATAASLFGCPITRNFYETSHAKGPQDAAGGYLKQQADLAVLRGKRIIQSAEDFYQFVAKELSTPKETAICKARVFRYVPVIPRDAVGYFRPIPSIRKNHQVRATSSNSIITRNLSYYACDSCFSGNYERCDNLSHTGAPISLNIENIQPVDKLCDDADEETQIHEL